MTDSKPDYQPRTLIHSTPSTREGEYLTRVYAEDDPDAVSGTRHAYTIADRGGTQRLRFQHGPAEETWSFPGILDNDLLAILIDRFEGFQRGQFACEQNAQVLEHLRSALASNQRRDRARVKQGVEGRNLPHTDDT